MNKLPLTTGDVCQSAGEAVYGPAEYSAVSNSGAKGPITIHGYHPSDSRNFFRMNDGSRDVTFDGLEFTGLWRVWITVAERIAFKNCHFHHNRMEGIILGACTNALIEDCVSEFCGPHYMNGYSDSSHHEPSADHAYYISYGGENNTLRRSVGRHTSGCGFHCYGNGDEGEYQRNFVGEDLAFLYCGSEGTPCVQPDGTEDSTLTNILVARSPIGGFTWDAGDGMPCKNWTIDGLTMWNPDAKFNIHLAPGTTGITYRNSIFVLADAPLCESTEGGHFEWPRFENCLICESSAHDIPESACVDCTFRDISYAADLFPRALQNDFAPTDPGVPGFRDWRPAQTAKRDA